MIGSEEKQVLADLVDVVRSLDLPMILVGAGARLLIFDQQFGAGRSTKDWDVAISIDSWEVYQELRTSLTTGEYPRFKSTKNSHKFIHIETNIEVDIVPFGEIGEPDQEITWSDSGNSMNVLGFAEALLSAKTTTIDELEIQVVDTPAFVVLKLFAWGDRGERTNKDLEDIDFILSKYEDDERVYSELSQELVDGVVDFLDANIYLLGQDICKILQQKTLVELNLLLNKLVEYLDYDEAGSLGYKLKVLQQGISSISAQNQSF
ncbi:nucleotidyl transferase AbiEii/AbiGii toxin family protein [Spirulina subsalsa FACHB-351]|uniref:Nucleotidyl transferase AbiEii/AbiGii toxin family protein n=1 Tax=Spirulina subsalsa FACHB-351 TaxID=234711 RepID=A0ABT3L4B4_9CYAN|nr:nucleotidyl transferase AbiEii/AbiGii toxin family protein [Spirulina subsalsa]MCW6036346.1 nucleotidyl transferase AbiEii/AbiGii toxin family protein [Spirulina subsalsa FACHB-351]